MRLRERPHRLPEAAYVGQVKVAITCSLRDRCPLFTSEGAVAPFRERLFAAAAKEEVEVIIYCFMPDHLHAVLRGRNATSNLRNFMKRFKQSTGYWFRQSGSGSAWEGDFYDHVIRNYEDFREQCLYAFTNPARSALVEDSCDHPFTDCGVMPLSEFIASLY